jgi:DNA-binding response OmpR family regulator
MRVKQANPLPEVTSADGAAVLPCAFTASMKSSLPQPIILVIDDDAITLTGVAAILHGAGYECHCARGAESAHKAARSLALDLIICDVNLGGENGIDLCRDLRRIPGVEEVPVMFVSGVQVPDIIRRSHDAGGAYFLRKPFDPEVMIELVGKALWMPHLVQAHLAQSRENTPAMTAPHNTIPVPNMASFVPQGNVTNANQR